MEQYIGWSVRISAGLSIFAALILIKKTIKSWKLDNERLLQNNETRNRYFQWLNRLSLLSMICNVFVLITILFSTFPPYCIHTNGAWSQLWSLSKGLLTIFQVIRVQYTLSSKQVHSSFGLSNWLFYVIYAIAIVSILYNLGVSRFTFMIKPVGDNDTFCVERLEIYKFVEYQLGAAVVEIVLDITIVILFARKVSKVMEKIRDFALRADAGLTIWINIRHSAKKLLYLQLILGLCSFTQWIIYGIQIVPIMMQYQYLALNMVHIIGSLICVIIAYLMNERHDKHYRAIMNGKCCCCCRTILDEVSDENDPNDRAKTKETEMTNTKSANPVEEKYHSMTIKSAMSEVLVNDRVMHE